MEHNEPGEEATWPPLLAERLFAHNVKTLREAQGLTQAALARALTQRGVPISQTAIAKLERADDAKRRPVRLVEAAAIATYFRQSLDDLVGDARLGEWSTEQLEGALAMVEKAAVEAVADYQRLSAHEQELREKRRASEALAMILGARAAMFDKELRRRRG